jgi:hypothetical protein
MTVRTAPAVAAAALAFALPASAAQGPTLAATPTTVGALSAVALSGTGGSGKAGAAVFVEAKECNASFYRVVAGTTTSVGGSWSTNAPVQRTTTFRARIGGAHSNTVVVRKRAVVALARSKTPGGRRLFVASVHSGWDLAGRPIRLERYTASGWVLVAQKKLQRNAVWGETQATFRIRRSGLRLRAYVPLTSARPCFVAAASSIIRS